MTSYDEFENVNLRSGTIIETKEFPKARKAAYKIWVDFGSEIGILQTSAQVTKHYTLKTLIGKKIIGCINLGEKNIGGFKSHFLLLGFSDKDGDILLASADSNTPDGCKLH